MESRQPGRAQVGGAERPPRIDSVVFARRNEVLSGSAPLSSMPRLLSAGVSADGSPGAQGGMGVSADGVSAVGVSADGVSADGVSTGGGSGDGVSTDGADAEGPPDEGRMLDWEVEGSLGRDEMQRQREFLRVRTRFSPWMTCSRCLAPVQLLDLTTDTRFRLAASESQAAAEDREEESLEVIAADPNLDLAALVEDEAILALPMAPAHASCQWMNTAGPEFFSGL